MMDNRGSFYTVVVALFAIVLGSFLWVVMNQQLETIEDTFANVTPSGINSTVHSTQTMKDDYALGESIFYFLMFMIGALLIFWSIKRTQEERAIGGRFA